MQNEVKILTADIRFIIDENFPTDSKIAELRKKMEGIRKDVYESMEAIQHMEKLHQKKILISN